MKKVTILLALLLAISCATHTYDVHQFDSEATYMILHPEGDGTISESVGTLHDYIGQGNYVLLDFWSIGCKPCQPEIPKLVKLYDKYRQYGLVVLGVPFYVDAEDIKSFMQDCGITYDQVLDASMSLQKSFSVHCIPLMILLGPDGEMIDFRSRSEDIERTIWKKLIKEKLIDRRTK